MTQPEAIETIDEALEMIITVCGCWQLKDHHDECIGSKLQNLKAELSKPTEKPAKK